MFSSSGGFSVNRMTICLSVLIVAAGSSASAQGTNEARPELIEASYQATFPVYPDTTIQPQLERIHAAIPLDPANIALVSVVERELRASIQSTMRVIVMRGGVVSPDMRLVGASADDAATISNFSDGEFRIRFSDLATRQVSLTLDFADDEGRRASERVMLSVLPPLPSTATVSVAGSGALRWMAPIPTNRMLQLDAYGSADSGQYSLYTDTSFPYAELRFYRIDPQRILAGPQLVRKLTARPNLTWPAALGGAFRRGDIVQVEAIPKTGMSFGPETIMVYSLR